MTSHIDRDKAEALRKEGKTYPEISEILGCSIDWCKKNLRDIEKGKSLPRKSKIKREWRDSGKLFNQLSFKNKILRMIKEQFGKYFQYHYFVYYMYNKDGELLYIGSTQEIFNRFIDHEQEKEGIYLVVLKLFDSYPEMIFTEANDILLFKPLNNKRIIASGNPVTHNFIPKDIIFAFLD